MQDIEIQQSIKDIIEYAQSAKPSEFRLIANLEDYDFHLKKIKTVKRLLTSLNKSARSLFKKYCQGIVEGDADFNMLLAYKQLTSIISFYEKELLMTINMVDDYETYLISDNFRR